MGVLRMAGAAVVAVAAVAGAQDAGWTAANPFFHASSLPYQAPPFDRIKDADYEPAMVAGMAQQTAEVRAIADDPAAPTFANTILALEKSGELLSRVSAAFGGVTGAYTNPALEKVQQEMAPKGAAHHDAIYLDGKLFHSTLR